jgi:hypothetical protein
MRRDSIHTGEVEDMVGPDFDQTMPARMQKAGKQHQT